MAISKTYARETIKKFNKFYNVIIEWDLTSFESNGVSDHHYECEGFIYGYDYYGNEYTMSAEYSCGELYDWDYDLIEKI
jgi:hypothetical protein